MNDFTTGITAYPAAVLYTAIAAVFKKRLSSATLGEKLYADKLSDACFYLLLALCAVGSCLTFPITRTPFVFGEAAGITLASLSAAELIYSTYEKVGLKKLVKSILGLLSGKSDRPDE